VGSGRTRNSGSLLASYRPNEAMSDVQSVLQDSELGVDITEDGRL
jgi:hypothetical protein